MLDAKARRELNRGFGDGLSRAFELATTPILFGLAGYGLDRWIGTVPVFTAVLGALATIGMFLRLWYGYDHDMRQHEAGATWAAGGRRAEPDVDLWGTGEAP